jgi:hypothetical protein
MGDIKELAKELCEKSPCHHKCHDTKDCVVEDEALLLINQTKSNNFDVKNNEELFKQALVEGVNRRIDKTIEIEVITYEQDRFNHFINLMEKAQKSYDRLYKRYKDSPYLFEGTTLLSDAGRELQFYKDVIVVLGQSNQKQSEWISVEDRLPEDYNKYLLFLDNGRITIGWYHGDAMQFVEDGIVMIETVTHWMPLPEAPKMKGGEE